MMSKRLFILLVLLMSLSLIGIIFVQAYYINNTVENKEEQFTFSVNNALIFVSNAIEERESKEYFYKLQNLFNSSGTKDSIAIRELFIYQEDDNLWNKILKITESENKLQNAEIILDKIPGSPFTNGGFLKFGPDEKLYVGTGTISDASHLPQDLDSLSGKILRLNDDGTIPDDNPFPNSFVYSLGHRNPQGMTWDDDENLFVAEFGPEKNDEINLVLPGKNYGWPEQECSGNENFEDAILCYDPSIEPGGILFYSGNAIDFEFSFIMASMRSTNLYQLDFEEGLSSQKSILSGIGRVRDVVQGPDGSLYVITSNTDGKGFPDSMDDKLLRILK